MEVNRLFRTDGTIGLFGRGGAGWANWNGVFLGNGAAEAVSINGFVGYVAVGLHVVSPEDEVLENTYQIGAELGAAIRALGDGIGQSRDFRQDNLGTERTLFVGPEFTPFLRLNQILLFGRFTYFVAKRDDVVDSRFEDVSGLTGLQGFLGVKILSSFFTYQPES